MLASPLSIVLIGNLNVKKGIVVLLVVVALLVLLSPGLIGRMAEKSVDENLNWAAEQSGGVVVTSESFDRGWFSSQGQHRVRIDDDNLKVLLGSMDEPPDFDELPVLVIDTRLDHGLIPVGSMSREKGSLAPGLGSAVSTLSIELASGETVSLPGAVYSKISLGGSLQSSYVLPSGSFKQDGGAISWDDTEIEVTTNPSSGKVSFSGDIGSLKAGDGVDQVALAGLEFSGYQQPTAFGFAVGDIRLELGDMSITSGGVEAGGLTRMSIDASSRLDNGRLSGHSLLELDSKPVPQFGEFSLNADVSLAGADAEAIGALQRSLEVQGTNADPDPTQFFTVNEEPIKRLLASGIELRFDRLDVTMPMGTVTSRLNLKVSEEDTEPFEWTSLLLNTQAEVSVSVPQAVVDMAVQMNPQVGVAVGMGFLQQDGDAYSMDAVYKKGLLTINGAPMPVPFGDLQ